MFSLAFNPVYPLEQQIRLSWFSALMWQQCLLRFGLKAHIKWPNDLYVGKQKIGGILIEQQLKGAQLEWSILGCGINVNEAPELAHATSIYKETAQRFKPLTVLAEYLDLLNGQQHLLNGDFAYLKTKFEAELWLKDTLQVFENPDGMRFEGRIIGVSDVGEIRIEINGEIANFANQELRYCSI
jgi:BirA family biotin operon repressor/biotin-[acetyl-CoA-carboxylase] ligase